jgi:hypothetical protein
LKTPNDTIGNRTPDIPACSAVHQPTAPPRVLATKLHGVISLKTIILIVTAMRTANCKIYSKYLLIASSRQPEYKLQPGNVKVCKMCVSLGDWHMIMCVLDEDYHITVCFR